MSETHESVPNWMRWLSRLILCAGVILYAAILIYETHSANEPHLWRDVWKDIWIIRDNSVDLALSSVFFFDGLAILWFSLPAFYSPSPAGYKYALLGLGLFATAYGGFGALSSVSDSYGEVDFDSGLSLLAFAVIYGSAFLLSRRSLPLVSVLFRKATGIFHHLSIVVILLWVFVAFAIGALGSIVSIETFVEEQYHSG